MQPELLLPLAGLTSLSSPQLKDDEIPQLLMLTRLQALLLREAEISDQGLRQLSALRQLTRLDACSDRFSRSKRGATRCVSLRKVGSVVSRVHTACSQCLQSQGSQSCRVEALGFYLERV